MRLLPLTAAELWVHALELESESASRYGAYAQRMRDLEEWEMAAQFDLMHSESCERMLALRAGTNGREPAELSPWEYAWRLTYCPDAIERRPRLVPMSAREALQLALMARRRAEAYFDDVSANARDSEVRQHAAGMLTDARRTVSALERRLTGEIRAEQLIASTRSEHRLPG